VVSFTPQPLYPEGKSPWYPLDRRLGEKNEVQLKLLVVGDWEAGLGQLTIIFELFTNTNNSAHL
jgi:hypothetical protein